MYHEMKLHPQPFDRIASGKKTIELRLHDEKRKKIQIGDTIIFSKTTDPSERLETQVTGLYPFRTFEELYYNLPLHRCGYLPEELLTASPKDMEAYYSLEKQAKYGVLGIEINLRK